MEAGIGRIRMIKSCLQMDNMSSNKFAKAMTSADNTEQQQALTIMNYKKLASSFSSRR